MVGVGVGRSCFFLFTRLTLTHPKTLTSPAPACPWKPWTPSFKPRCWTCCARWGALKWWSAGTTPTRGLAAGSRVSTSTPNNRLKRLNARAVSIVVDPIQSVRGKVVLDAFRLINPQTMMLGQEPRQVTSNVGHLAKPSIQALIHGLNRHYYSIAASYRKNAGEEAALGALRRRGWAAGLTLRDFAALTDANEATLTTVSDLASTYAKAVAEEGETAPGSAAREVAKAGRSDARRRLGEAAGSLMADNVVQACTAVVATLAF